MHVRLPSHAGCQRAILAGLAVVALGGCGVLRGDFELVPADPTAPPVCGFEPGTVLGYAGRSTTRALDVQEALGDPMAMEPADVYITADEFSQGELTGRLVCAVYDDPGFVEITVHPADGGRVHPPTPAPPREPPGTDVAVADVHAAARAELDDPSTWKLQVTESGPLESIASGSHLDDPWADGVAPDRWVWSIFFTRDDEAFTVVIDYVTGVVLGTQLGLIN